MQSSDTAFQGQIPQLYDRLMGPMLFKPYAADLAQRLAGLSTGHVLETAAGTGIVTRALAATLPETVAITATDLNQPMLDHAAAQPGAPRVRWQQADAQKLPFADSAFDAVVCQFGIMFFPDKRAGQREAVRVLKPGGRFLFNVWSEIDRNRITNVVERALAGQFAADPPRFMSRVPFAYNDIAAITAELAAVGFTAIRADRVTLESRSASARDAATALCHGTPLRAEIEARDAARLEAATEAAARALTRELGEGPIAAPMEAIVFECARPA
ncbi:MAG TPA: methyltransferase domain-containing protein [Vineibacter sp.]|nr:methyltransferase domain-containing protein [Vineibacter sp.]